MAQYWLEVRCKIKKPCSECGASINPGQSYFRIWVRDRDKLNNNRSTSVFFSMCAKCAKHRDIRYTMRRDQPGKHLGDYFVVNMVTDTLWFDCRLVSLKNKMYIDTPMKAIQVSNQGEGDTYRPCKSTEADFGVYLADGRVPVRDYLLTPDRKKDYALAIMSSCKPLEFFQIV